MTYQHERRWAEMQKVITLLQDIGDSIEIIAHEIARQPQADE